MTGRFTNIATIRNEIEALCLRGELEERGIPHTIHSYYDLAYDGLFQVSRGWGHVAASAEHTDEIIQVLNDIRERSGQHGMEAENGPETGAAG